MCYAQSSAPELDNVFPGAAPVGARVSLFGANFGDSQSGSTVTFNGVVASVTYWSDSSISVLVPAGASNGPVIVNVDGVASNAFSFTVAPQPTIVSLSPPGGPVNSNTNLTISGTGFGPSSFAAQVTFDNKYVNLVSWSDSQIVVQEPAGDASVGPVPVRISFWSDRWFSNTVNFNLSALHVDSTFPTWGPVGGQIRVQGEGFGNSQNGGSLAFNGVTASVVSWSDTQITAAVPSGAVTGPVTVSTGGFASNGVNFTVTPPPTIVSLSPLSGILSNSSQITINGSGFGASSFAASVFFGGASATINSWSDTSITFTSPGSYSDPGPVPVYVSLAGGAFSSNTVSFNVGELPALVGVSPASGPFGTLVTLTGSNFGSTQGGSQVLIAGIPFFVTGWSDSLITAPIPGNLTTGQLLPVTVVTSAGVSNALGFTVNAPVTGVQLSPSMASMVVGETRTFQANNSSGSPLTGLSWSSSDNTIVSLSTDDPPIVTALAPGQATLMANDATATITVYPGPVLPDGTVKWSVPGDLSGVTQILPAVPSSTGVADVFALQTSGQLMAIASDGKVGWQANVGLAKTLLPDFQGGLVTVDTQQIKRFDGMTGQAQTPYTYATPPIYGNPLTAVHTDGTIFTIDGNSIVGIDPHTGTPKFTIPLEHGTFDSASNPPECEAPLGTQHSDPPAFVSNLIIAGDGYAYITYRYNLSTHTQSGCYTISDHNELHWRLLRVASNGDHTEIVLHDWASDTNSLPLQGDVGNGCTAEYGQSTTRTAPIPLGASTLITDADTGVTLTWSEGSGQYNSFEASGYGYCVDENGTYHQGGVGVQTVTVAAWSATKTMTITGGSPGTEHDMGLGGQQNSASPVLQAADGSYFGVMQVDDISYLSAFDKDGDVRWRKVGDYQPLIATADGGVIARLAASNGVFRVMFDDDGNVTSQVPDDGRIQTWKGNIYRYGSVDQVAGAPAAVTGSFVASSVLYSGTSVNFFPPLASCANIKNPPSPCLAAGDAMWNALQDLITQLEADVPCAQTAQASTFRHFVDANGFALTAKNFVGYLESNTPHMSDGTQSRWDYENALCGKGRSNWFRSHLVNFNCNNNLPNVTTIQSFFALRSDDAITETPSYPFTVFLRPTSIETTGNGETLNNEGLIFHEALHGITGASDIGLQTALGLSTSEPSSNVTDYLITNVLLSCPISRRGGQ
jgi:hypothetical protein